MARLSLEEFSAGLPIQRQGGSTGLPQATGGKSFLGTIGRTVADVPSDVIDTIGGLSDVARSSGKMLSEAWMTPELTAPQRVAGTLAAPIAGIMGGFGELVKGGAKLFTTPEAEQAVAGKIQQAGQAAAQSDLGQQAKAFYDNLPEDQKYQFRNIFVPALETVGAFTGAKSFIAGIKSEFAQSLKEGVKETLKPTVRTAAQAADDVVRAANPTMTGGFTDTVKGLTTQVKDYAGRVVKEAQDTATQAKRLETMEPTKASLIRKGADERVINVIEQSPKDEVKIIRELVDQAKKKEIDPTPNTPQPKQITGRELLKPVEYIINERKSVGAKLGELRKGLGETRNVNTNSAFRSFHQYLKDNYAVQFDKTGQIIPGTGTLARADVKTVQGLYDELRSGTFMSEKQIDNWLQRTYKDYDLLPEQQKTFTEEVSRIAERARQDMRQLMPDEYNQLATEYAKMSTPLKDFVKLTGYKGDLDKLTAKELKAGEVALRVLGNAADRPQSVIDDLLKVAKENGYQSDIDLNRLIYITDQLEDLYDITPSRGLSGSITRGADNASIGAAADIATMNMIGLFNRAATSKATQKEMQEAFEAYINSLPTS